VAFVPADGSTLGIGSVTFVAYGSIYVICSLLLKARFETDEHKALQRSIARL
jgi:hypothetical protein